MRFYQKKGVLKINKKQRRSNNCIESPGEAIQILSFSKKGKELGFTLNETKTFLYYWENNMTGSIDLNKMAIDKKIKQLKEFKN